jgi:hypothetical protein
MKDPTNDPHCGFSLQPWASLYSISLNRFTRYIFISSGILTYITYTWISRTISSKESDLAAFKA